MKTKKYSKTELDEITAFYAQEAEQSVLGGLMLENDRWDEITPLLKSEDFFSHPHRIIWQKMSELCQANFPIDLITLHNSLEKSGQVESVGGFAYIAELSKNTPSAANIVYYAEMVAARSRARGLMTLGKTLVAESSNPRTDIFQLCEQTEKQLFLLSEKSVGSEQRTLMDSLSNVINQLENALEGNGVTGTPTGFIELDEKTCGLQSGDLILLGARPSMGKTALALAIAQSALNKGSVQFYSIEMPTEQLIQRLISNLASIPLGNIRSGLLDDSEWGRIGAAMEIISSWQDKFVIDDTSNMTPPLLRTRARRNMRKFGQPSLIIVDYLQLMSSPNQENRTLEISEISRNLKALGKELGCPVLALSQLNRQLAQRGDKRPVNGDLRDSGSLEQDADLVLFLYRDEVYNENSLDKGIAEIIISKQRQGPLGTVKVGFNGEYTRFCDFTHGYDLGMRG
ncbi:SPI-7-type island replicative DNA helicase [Xenorhabdus koppenhoeferi]|uniref:Replicative DNA helicase n=1 Tax=Xenorhabdus koppenhoeferi TaxID=351659 RepID=A0A1I7H517_9GAMM|nr:SPI-7-type island replicative DNA helicase [Xenorhabdus koppenhoeferi]CEE94247.1 Replicative DNA helicase [Xenorhabdus nematophila str. Anatoliense]SFU55750.1 replicative DNA helicase (phage and plasmid) [Xenorhabdus koppenhoeferi]